MVLLCVCGRSVVYVVQMEWDGGIGVSLKGGCSKGCYSRRSLHLGYCLRGVLSGSFLALMMSLNYWIPYWKIGLSQPSMKGFPS